ncbi:RDD family protein [Nocardioides halotolerans]|jgi:uncharacterized RDD family membrane protein YckC|uniref:RDD family protein n=1 Tax=Nocardioides halotolerans TaxID=433660 RepID=UPI0003F53518|nr:RDD family protein [Nocardioides halotolerans]
MSTPPPEQGPVPPGYRPGDYVPFKDRDPANPSAIAGQWADPALQAQLHGQQAGRALTPQEQYRAIYGDDAPVRVEFASWGRRVLGYLVDAFLGAVAGFPLVLGYFALGDEVVYETDAFGNRTISDASQVSGTTTALLIIGALLSLAFHVYNQVIRQGRTGYSLGKTAVGIKLVRIETSEPMGAGWCFVRSIAHVLDSLVCYLGWLWPIWDRRNQTLADKVMGTVVIIEPDTSGRQG